MSVSMRMGQGRPTIDYSTFEGKLQILRDVKEHKYPLPNNFPTMAQLFLKNAEM